MDQIELGSGLWLSDGRGEGWAVLRWYAQEGEGAGLWMKEFRINLTPEQGRRIMEWLSGWLESQEEKARPKRVYVHKKHPERNR